MPKIQLPIKNFAAQNQIFDFTDARYMIVPKGRRFGLTRGAANDMIKKALTGKFKRGLWVDTVNVNIDRYIDRYFMPALKKLPESMYERRKQEKILIIKDSYIDFRSSDRPENIEGFGYDWFFINEAGIVLKNEYLWSNAIRPMLWDYQARGVIGGTPKGKGVFEESYQRGLDPSQTLYKSLRFTTFDNPHLNAPEIMEEIKSMPERVVKQEIYAEFLDDTGVVFRGTREVAILQPQKAIPGHLYVMGVDLAKVQDYTVVSVYDRKNNNQVFQARFNKLDWPFQKAKIQEISRAYNRAVAYIDATGVGDPIADELLRAGVPVEPIKLTNELKKQMIEKIANMIELKDIHMLQLDETVNEFNSFTYDISSTGKIRYNAPVGFHDDIVISHALAVWALFPIPIKQKEKELTIIEKDINEKIKAQEDDAFEYDVI